MTILSPAPLRWVAVAAAAALLVGVGVREWPRDPVEVLFAFSPDAEEVLQPMIDAFNESYEYRIEVVPEVLSSGSAEANILAGDLEPVLWMPAASTWGRLLDEHVGEDYVPSTNPSFFWSPEVFGIWHDVREAIGDEVAWRDLEALARDDRDLGDAAPFRFGHTKPTTSTSGLFAMVSAYTEAGATDASGVARRETTRDVARLERSVRHYGDIADDFCQPLLDNTTTFVSAVYMQETTLLRCKADDESGAVSGRFDEVYPENGTYAADYPCIVLQAPWVDAAERDAALEFRRWLAGALSEEMILAEYLRVGSPQDPVPGPIPSGAVAGPTAVEDVPPGSFLEAVQDGWTTTTRKAANVQLVLEWSSQMSRDGLWVDAVEMLDELVGKLAGSVRVGASLVRFGDEIDTPVRPSAIGTSGPALDRALDPNDGPGITEDSVLFDTVIDVVDRRWMNDPDAIDLLVIVSTGEDVGSEANRVDIQDVLGRSRSGPSPPQVVGVQVGPSADGPDDLRFIADEAFGRVLTLIPAGTTDVAADRYTAEDAAGEIASLV